MIKCACAKRNAQRMLVTGVPTTRATGPEQSLPVKTCVPRCRSGLGGVLCSFCVVDDFRSQRYSNDLPFGLMLYDTDETGWRASDSPPEVKRVIFLPVREKMARGPKQPLIPDTSCD